jgi:asparagine synthase (glutamine-hydrolysing)
MSAIAGIFRTDGQEVERRDLERMANILAHRGPDGSGVWNTGSIGLAHRLLWTTPESLHEHLPRLRSESNLVVTADVRIDNRADLIAQLRLTGVPAVDVTDSELILRAYELWEEDCASYLLGDFAFAIWDPRRNRLFCARDHLGVKPFFYFHQPGHAFVFASEIKALRILTGVPSRLNELAVADHLVPQYFDATSTYYQDILRLPPAHYLVVTPEKTRLQRYWSLDPSRELRLKTDAEYAEEFRHLFTEAVRSRMRSAFPVGSMLSGGLDSSSITCVARSLHATNNGSHGWPTFSAVHDVVTECDESRYINAVLARGGYEPSVLQADRVSPLCDLDRVLWHQDEPLVAGNLYLNSGLYRHARERGIRVLLDGYDGDTTVSHGLGFLVELANSDRWLRLASEVVPFARRNGEPSVQALWSWLWRYELDPLTANTRGVARIRRWAASRLSSRRATSSAPVGAEWLAIFNPDFAKRADPAGRRRARDGVAPTTEREAHHRRLSDAGMPHTLEVLDRAASAFALEPRFPFCDRRLVEFCLSLPPAQKIRRGWSRMVLRRGMDGILPPLIQWRGSKTNHHAGFERGMLTFERDLLNELVYERSDLVAPYVDVGTLRQQLARSLSPARTDATFNVVWLVVSLALWLRRADLGTDS